MADLKNKSTQNNNIPTILIVFGITGDLAIKKIIPSLRHLFEQNLLSDHFSILGFARNNFSAKTFKEFIRSALMSHGGKEMSRDNFFRFVAHFSYQSGTFEDAAAFQILAQSIADKEALWGICANKLFYLAAPPSSYEPIFKNLADVKLNRPCGGQLGWSRVLIEKPFGIDLTGAQKLQSLLSLYFKEEQIYRIDHYLFKEIVQGIENFRFSNNLFENTWDNTTIERIDIRLRESIGVLGRGGFYDRVGALRDVGQNHLLAMLATLLMEFPAGDQTDTLRKNRARILQALTPWTKSSIQAETFRAQYKGYRKIDGVRQNSTIETYFALKTKLTLSRFRGVPIFMEAGKQLPAAQKEIMVTLKHPEDCLLCEIGPHQPNRLIFRLEPNDEIIIHFWTKKPGFDRILEERVFSFFIYEKKTKVQYAEEYGKVLYAAMRGEQMSFVSAEEIEAAWKFIDPIVDGWKRDVVPLAEYEPGAAPIPSFLQNNSDVISKETSGEIGIIGLGKMGANIARRLIEKGWRVAGFNKTPDATKELEPAGLRGAYALKEFVEKLPKPRTIWLMVPYQAVDQVLAELTPLLSRGDTIIDGGNSPYKESTRRSKELADKNINFLDVGVSGGPAGARGGACLMVGGEKKLYKKYERLFKDLAVLNGYGYMGKTGAGHFVKMIHNGIEYGMMQALAEGFAVLKEAKYKLDLARITDIYNHGSVIESRLAGWLKNAFELYGDGLKKISGSVGHTGEGEWTVKTAKALRVKVKILEEAMKFRVASEKNPSYTGKILAALRQQFGGHDVRRKKGK